MKTLFFLPLALVTSVFAENQLKEGDYHIEITSEDQIDVLRQSGRLTKAGDNWVFKTTQSDFGNPLAEKGKNFEWTYDVLLGAEKITFAWSDEKDGQNLFLKLEGRLSDGKKDIAAGTFDFEKRRTPPYFFLFADQELKFRLFSDKQIIDREAESKAEPLANQRDVPGGFGFLKLTKKQATKFSDYYNDFGDDHHAISGYLNLILRSDQRQLLKNHYTQLKKEWETAKPGE